MKETIQARKNFFNLSEVSQILGLHRNTIKNMVDDGRIITQEVGKRNMVHSSEIYRIKNGESREDEQGLIDLDMKIKIKMDELNSLLDERRNFGKLSRDEFMCELAKLKKGFKEG